MFGQAASSTREMHLLYQQLAKRGSSDLGFGYGNRGIENGPHVPESSILSVKAERPQFEFLPLHEGRLPDKSVVKNVERTGKDEGAGKPEEVVRWNQSFTLLLSDEKPLFWAFRSASTINKTVPGRNLPRSYPVLSASASLTAATTRAISPMFMPT